MRRRWDEEHIEDQGTRRLRLRVKAKFNDGMASRLQAAEPGCGSSRRRGPPEAVPLRQNVRMRLSGGRTAKRAVVVEGLELRAGAEGEAELMRPFDAEIWFGERVGILGSNGSGKSHFLRLLAAGGSDPDLEHRPVGDFRPSPVPAARVGRVRLGSRALARGARPDPRCADPSWADLLEILHRGDEHRTGMPRDLASRALDRYGLAGAAEQVFDSLSVGSRRACRSCCSSCPVPRCCC